VKAFIKAEFGNHIPGWEDSTVFMPGAGTLVLIDELLRRGVRLVLNDISIEALNRVAKRLDDEYNDIVWLCQDIAQPIKKVIPKIDIWIDRAVLHFLTEEDDITGYFKNVESNVSAGGYATFLLKKKHCHGLSKATLMKSGFKVMHERI
jgi:hypothetical protein